MSKPQAYKLEEHVNDCVKAQFEKLSLKSQKDYYTESAIPDYLKEALKGRAKTENKTNFGKPDFSLTRYKQAPVIIENKLGLKSLVDEAKNGVKFNEKENAKSINNYAVNGALYYATGMIASGKYHEVIAVGIAGDSDEAIEIKVYYVYGSGEHAYKLLENVTTLDFLENEQTFNAFYKNASLTEDEKHEILINSQAKLQKYAKSLNKLMHNHNITAPQRVLYVSGMLLSMQNVVDTAGKKIQDGLTPEDLEGIQSATKRDGVQIVNQIKEFLTARNVPIDKQSLMLASFSEISKDAQRDELTNLDKEVSKLIDSDASSNKQIFSFIYYNIFLSIDAMAGHLDIMGEMYSEFLKYALGDGKEIGIVLTPPYITKIMAAILGINKDSKIMDLATGSAGFLISAMEMMIDDAEQTYGKKTSKAESKISDIKATQLLGVELNAEMFTLAATNMILRGDGSSNIQKGNTFSTPETLYTTFKANKLLLNPPFSYTENGMPFIAFGLDKMEKGGLAAIIIQDSAGSGKAVKTNQAMLKKHTLIASIKMPTDLFEPMANVQTSIYILQAHKPHDVEQTVKFIDFRNDGYKRTSRALQEIDQPTARYADIIRIYKAGKNAKVEADWRLNEIYVEDFITTSGADWNFDQHKTIDTKPTFDDFRKTVADYLAWEVEQLLKNDDDAGKAHRHSMQSQLAELEKNEGIEWREYEIGDLFKIQHTLSFNKDGLTIGSEYDYVTRTSQNQGILQETGFVNNENINAAGTWSLGLLQMDFFYRKKPWYAGQFVRKIVPKIELSKHSILYFTVLFNKQKQNLLSGLVRSVDKAFLTAKVRLPTKSSQIDFDFIEKFIVTLNAERIVTLNAYLKATGLTSYNYDI